ncbi:Retrovirus-related Pol polyprotein from transposon RE1 [Vitis vinifera]|uniref:Retrovirus-related Pol polyprotein from transposon RE1 n=1 Tax=Vitis vinifera TaxID=29760 RepID=A0A438EDG5_VITVI|nr:Retrovirus-related Pol polyprotein from transposon RE1 [Vitis vinifera]
MLETTEPGFRKWKIENSMIMSWLINSMNNDIGENFLLFGTAKDIWDAAKETYSSSENTSELFQVESALHDFRQGEQSVTQYYNTLTRYWQQLDLFETHSWKCSDDAATYRQIVEQKRLFKFFLGLNRELDDVRGRIMGIKPLPSLREAFSEVRREESRKKVMMGSKEQPAPTLDGSALAARSFNSNGGDRQKRDRLGVIIVRNQAIIRRLAGSFMANRLIGNQSHDGDATETIEPSWQWQYYRDSPHASQGRMKPWIVDTGASDHMTGDAAILQNYKPSNGHSFVHIADGSKSKIAGTVLNCVPGSTSSYVANSQTKSLKQVAYSLRGESMNEHQVWESRLEGVPSVHSESPNPSQFPPTELSTPMPSSVQPAKHTNERKRQELEHGSQSTCGQYIDSNSSLPEENIGEDRAGEVLIPSIDDSTLPIALRKGLGDVPNTIQEALKISEWKKAVQDEIDALEKNETWTITDLPVGKRPVGCKWIFTIKYKADGSVERFKARLVARGFTQSYGIDYQETFALVAKLNTIRILLSLTVNQDWCLQQLNIKNAFLNDDLEEEVYMEIPPGFEESMAKNQVCKLQKSLYGLKQSPRAWFDRFTKAVLKLGYKQGQADHTLFVKKSHTGKMPY